MNFCLVLEYDGSEFGGWQVQSGDTRTVQGCLKVAAQRIAGVPAVVRGSGRTDAGVHAAGQLRLLPISAHGAGVDLDGAFFDVALVFLRCEHAVTKNVLPVFFREKLVLRFQELEDALVPLQPLPGRRDDTNDFALIETRIGETNLEGLASRNDGLNQFFDLRSRKRSECLWHG